MVGQRNEQIGRVDEWRMTNDWMGGRAGEGRRTDGRSDGPKDGRTRKILGRPRPIESTRFR